MIEKPQKFPGKKPDDKIVFSTQKHWIGYLYMLVFSFFAIVPVIVVAFFVISNLSIYQKDTIILITGICGVYLLILVSLIMYFFVDLYLDRLFLTQDRIVYIRQNGYFKQQVDEVFYKDIEELGIDCNGFFKSLLNYGDVIIHPGNEKAILTISDIGDPQKIADILLDKHKEQTGHNIEPTKES